MNNIELYQWFSTLDQGNIFDIQIALKKKENIALYKKSEFFKATKFSLKKAYALYSLNGISNITRFLNSEIIHQLAEGNIYYLTAVMENLIQNIDPTVIDDLLEYISDHLNQIDFTKLEEKLKEGLDTIKGAQLKF